MVRAGESQRPDRLLDDPLAAALLSAAPDTFDGEQRAAVSSRQLSGVGARFALGVIVRTRFFDDFMLAATQAGIGQVLLAAGLDTRAYRLDWPAGTTLYEFDQPQLLDFKQRVLDEQHAAPRCRAHRGRGRSAHRVERRATRPRAARRPADGLAGRGIAHLPHRWHETDPLS